MFPGLHVTSKTPRPTKYIFFFVGVKASSRFLFLIRARLSEGVKGARERGQLGFLFKCTEGKRAVMRRRIGNLMHAV